MGTVRQKFNKWSCGLVWFYSISTVVDNFMPNPIFAYILNIWFVNTFLDTQWSNSSISNNSF